MKLNNIIYGDFYNDDYVLIKENDKYYIVHTDDFGYESAILFKVATDESDWSKEKLLDYAKSVVDFLNGRMGY